MRKIVSLLSVLMLFCALAYGQARTVSGQVTDENGSPIPFASVVVKGTSRGVSADQNGRFSISVNSGDVLVISSQGRAAREVTVGTQTVINTQLGASTSLEEVVVTGAYNVKRTARSTSTNAQVVTAEQLNVIRQPNINNALAGKVSGLQVRSQSSAAIGREGDIRLRGEGGFGGGAGGVIYVVDGTIMPNSTDIPLDNVENVTVLQGPAASAQFGSQGANGAIVVTTKKGSRAPRGVGVEVNIGAQWDNVYILPNYQNSYGGGSTSDLMKYTWQPGHPVEWQALDGKYFHDYSDDASWGPRMVGQEYIPWYSWYGGHSRSYTTASLVPQEDNARDFFQTGSLMNNSVSFSKATDNMNIRILYGNVDQVGIIPTTGLDKNSFSLNTEVNLLRNLIFGANVNFITSRIEGDINDDYSNQSTGSFNQWFHRNVDMDIMKELRGLKTPEGIYASWNKANPGSFNPDNPRGFYAGNYWYNFYTWLDLAKSFTNRDRIFGDINLTYKLTNDLSIRGTYRRQQNLSWSEEKFSSALALSGLQTQGNEDRAWGYYSSHESNSNRQNVELMASFNRRFNDFQVNVNAGTDFFRWLYKSNGGNTNQGLNVPDLFSLTNSKDPSSVFNDRIEEKYRALLAFGNIGYKNMLFGEFTLRNDWYSTLPPENNDILSKSFGASFVFSDLVRSSVPWLTYGKIRAGWGEIPQALGTSTTTFGAYRYPGFQYSPSKDLFNGYFLMNTPNQIVDPNIHGAVKSQKEIGLELRALRDRIGLAATFWDGTETDMPTSVPINGTTGFTSILTNTGKITKKGIDLQLTARPVWMPNIKWELNATYGRLLENKVVDIDTANGINRVTVEGVWGTTAPYMVHQVGQDWGQIYGNGIKRLNGQPILDDQGRFLNDPNVYFGSVLPDYTGGIQNSFVIMNDFTLNANIDFQVGGKFVSLSDMWGSYSGLTARTATINDKGNPVRDPVADGGGIHVFGVDTGGHAVDYYVEAQDYFHNLYNVKAFDEFIYDLTFVKLRELSIGYNIPVNKIGNLSKVVNRANFSIVARNPLLIYAETSDLDPSEISRVSGERGNFPGTRGFGFNLKVGF